MDHSEETSKGNEVSEEYENASQDMLRTPILALKMLGVWLPESYERAPWKKIIYSCYTAFVIGLLLIFSVSAIVNLKDSISDLPEFTNNIIITTVTLNCIAKVWPFIFWRKQLLASMRTLGELTCVWGLTPGSCPQGRRPDRVLSAYKRLISRATTFACVFTLVTCNGWLSSPFLTTSDAHKLRPLPYGGWFPWDARWGQSGYWVAYASQVVCAQWDAIGTTAPNCFYVALLLYARASFRALHPALEALRPASASAAGNDATARDVLRRHQAALRFVAELSEFLGPLTFVQSLVMSLLLCSTVLHLTMISVWSVRFMAVFTFALFIMSELFVFCWLGTEIQIESEACGLRMYRSEWHNAPASPCPEAKALKASCLFVIQRAQRPALIRGFGFSILSLELFTSLVRLSYSFYALLHQMADSETI